LAGYIGAFFAWITLLRHAPVGPAFAASHLEKVSVVVVSVVWLGETLSMIQLAGVILVLGGIALLGLEEAGA
jgi:drug/metabolite transporter (DMT)-like permease